MNKLYILGALALSNVEAVINIMSTPGAVISAVVQGGLNVNIGGTYTYAYTADCIASTTLTSLGINNIYHQYYYYALTKGTAIYSSIGTSYATTIASTNIPTTLLTVTNVYSGCWHSHIYNWMVQPTVATALLTSLSAGFGSNVVGYGYAMVGTATTSCVASTMVTTTFFKTNVFYGAQYQSSIIVLTACGTTLTSLLTVPVWGKVGPGHYVAKMLTTAAASTTVIGVGLAIPQNGYWDFMQTNVIQGMTTLGRGGGALGTGPCGWYVGYFYEAPAAGLSVQTDLMNVVDDALAPTLNIWTDNSVVKAASAFIIAGLAGLLF